MDFYLGGYHLLKPRPLSFGSRATQTVFTASDCINDNLIGNWAYPWDTKARKDSAFAEETFCLEKPTVDSIRKWVGEKFEAKLIGWENVFLNKQTAIECKTMFFSHLRDVHLLAIYFDEESRNDILNEFQPESAKFGETGIYQMLMKHSLESRGNGETLIGFDLIGMEYGGGFHSFHCHDMTDELMEKFDLELNAFGLFDESVHWQEVLDHMNGEEVGCEPVPWYVAKVTAAALIG